MTAPALSPRRPSGPSGALAHRPTDPPTPSPAPRPSPPSRLSSAHPSPSQATLHPNPHYAADKAAKGGEAAEDRLGAAPMVSERDSTLVMS